MPQLAQKNVFGSRSNELRGGSRRSWAWELALVHEVIEVQVLKRVGEPVHLRLNTNQTF